MKGVLQCAFGGSRGWSGGICRVYCSVLLRVWGGWSGGICRVHSSLLLEGLGGGVVAFAGYTAVCFWKVKGLEWWYLQGAQQSAFGGSGGWSGGICRVYCSVLLEGLVVGVVAFEGCTAVCFWRVWGVEWWHLQGTQQCSFGGSGVGVVVFEGCTAVCS